MKGTSGMSCIGAVVSGIGPRLRAGQAPYDCPPHKAAEMSARCRPDSKACRMLV